MESLDELDESSSGQLPPSNYDSSCHALSVGRMNRDTWQNVFQYLDLEDVLNLRITAKLVYQASKFHDLWERLLKELRETMPGAYYLEKPLADHSGDELEKQVLTWHRSKIFLKTTDPKHQPKYTRIDLPRTMDKHRLHLLPGGKWLLGATSLGSVVYFNCHDPNPIPITLIPEQETTMQHVEPLECLVAIDYLTSVETLAFHLALFTRPTVIPGIEMTITIWKIQLQHESDLESSRLVAQRLVSFREENTRIDHCSIHDSLVAYAAPPGGRLTIIDWKDVLHDVRHPFRKEIPDSSTTEALVLLPNQRLLLVQTDDRSVTTFIYSWGPEEMPLPSDHQQGTTVFPNPLGYFLTLDELPPVESISRPYFFPVSTRFVLKTQLTIMGLIIPHAGPFRVFIIPFAQLEDFRTYERAACSYETVALSSTESTPLFHRMTWPSAPCTEISSTSAQIETSVVEGVRSQFSMLPVRDGEGDDSNCNDDYIDIRFDETSWNTLLIGGEEDHDGDGARDHDTLFGPNVSQRGQLESDGGSIPLWMLQFF